MGGDQLAYSELYKELFSILENAIRQFPHSLASVASAPLRTLFSLWLLWEEAQASGNLLTSSNGTGPMHFHVEIHAFLIHYFFIFMERP